VLSSDQRIAAEPGQRYVYADAVVVCGAMRSEPDASDVLVNPAVIVEVLSPSTEASDRGEKWRHYQRIDSLREYVLVSQGEPYVEVFRRVGDEWVLRTATAGQMLELPSQNVQIPVDAIYADPRKP
jgi:Uma2 family endonuclease